MDHVWGDIIYDGGCATVDFSLCFGFGVIPLDTQADSGISPGRAWGPYVLLKVSYPSDPGLVVDNRKGKVNY